VNSPGSYMDCSSFDSMLDRFYLHVCDGMFYALRINFSSYSSLRLGGCYGLRELLPLSDISDTIADNARPV
jgi:hypothetical protein